jgi:hypothetical protein
MDQYPANWAILPVVPGGASVRGTTTGPPSTPIVADGMYFGGTAWDSSGAGMGATPPSHDIIFGTPQLGLIGAGFDMTSREWVATGGLITAPRGVHGAATVQQKDVWGQYVSALAGIAPMPAQGAGNPGPDDPWDGVVSHHTNPTLAGADPDLGYLVDRAHPPRFGWAWQELVDANGTVVAWQDFTFDLEDSRRAFETFWGDPSCYSGVEVGWDGHVPTFLADFTSGLVPGSYRVRTWVYGYVQTREYVIELPAVEFPGTAYMEMDIFKGGTINAKVHYHIQELPSATVPNNGPWTAGVAGDQNLIVEAVDANGVVQAWNMTTDHHPPTDWFDGDPNSVTLTLVGESRAWEEMGRVHGMPEGTYTIKAHRARWVQQEFPQHTVQYCTNGSLSFHLIKGAIIFTTVYSRDCQDPTQPVNWQHPGEPIEVTLTSSGGDPFAPTYYLQWWHRQLPGVDVLPHPSGGIWAFWGSAEGGGGLVSDYYRIQVRGYGLPTDTYTLAARTPGYVQLQFPEVWAQKGTSAGDVPIYLLVAPEIRVVVDFKTELIPAPLPEDFYSYYFRIEAFDENGTLAAGNITAVPQASFKNHAQYPWLGNLNPAQPFGVQTWVFQLQGFSPFSTPVNRPWHGGFAPGVYVNPFPALGGQLFWQYRAYNNGGPKSLFSFAPLFGPPGDCPCTGIMWGKTYTIVVTEENQIGYVQLSTVTVTPTCKGITTVIFEMDRMARISGFTYTRNYMGDFRAGSWQTVTSEGAAASIKAWGPYDGYYYTYVQPDTYTVSAEGPGYVGASRTVVATWGGTSSGQDFYLEESGIPIPEFPIGGVLALISALAASLYLLRRRQIIPIVR